ncbi:MAG TPA: hypothetical protein VNQ79_16715 [Blastocatellia bacterium]|nr:hypothetical protein [Blastocatellia bacterium]
MADAHHAIAPGQAAGVVNGVVSSLACNDTLDRTTQLVQAIWQVGAATNPPAQKRQTTIAYDNLNRTITTTGDQNTFNDNLLKSTVFYDGLGRTTRQAGWEGNTGAGNTWTVTETQFDGLGWVAQVSHPFRATDPVTATSPAVPAGTWTTTTYDALSRALTVTTPDTATVTTAYSGNQVMVTDQAGKQRLSKTNALGWLTDVWEIKAAEICIRWHSEFLLPAVSNVFDGQSCNRCAEAARTVWPPGVRIDALPGQAQHRFGQFSD